MSLKLRFGIGRHITGLFAPDDAMSGNPWADYEEKLIRLDAVITDINIKGSDPTLQLRAADGVNWTIELGSHDQNRKAGLEQSDIGFGDQVSVTGRQAESLGENRIKAIELIINNRRFHLYPAERVVQP